MARSWEEELPDCCYEQKQPSLIKPSRPTPNHILYLSNIDDQKFLRFSIKYLYLFQNSVPIDLLKSSLSKVLVDYYPLAGRLQPLHLADHHEEDNYDKKLQVDCNGEGAVFAEAFMDITVEHFLQISNKPNKSWRKLLFKVDAPTFVQTPPLVVQVTKLRCGGMIVCTAINHCLCDGIGTSQFLHAWAHHTTKNPIHTPLSLTPTPPIPFHSRHLFKPPSPSSHLPPNSFHPAFTKNPTNNNTFSLNKYLQSQPLVPSSLTYTSSHINHLKTTQCAPSIKCTTFEVLASHTWRSWVKSLDLPSNLKVKLLFSMNIRNKVTPNIPKGYYANGFVLACAKTSVQELVDSNLNYGVKLVQEAKSNLTDDCVNGIVELLEDKSVTTDLNASLVISQWSKLGLEDLDFGQGKPLHMGPLTSDIYCLFLPVIGDPNAIRVLVSLPKSVVGKFEYYMNDFLDTNSVEANGNHENGNLLL